MRRLTKALDIVVLGSVILLAAYFVACGGQSEPNTVDTIDIEATVQARLNDELRARVPVTAPTKEVPESSAESQGVVPTKVIQTQMTEPLPSPTAEDKPTSTFVVTPLVPSGSATGPPSMPVIYAGSVSQGGKPVIDGRKISATVAGFTTLEVSTSGGRYVGLAVGPPSIYAGETIIFQMGRIQAFETDVVVTLSVPKLKSDFDLTFPSER